MFAFVIITRGFAFQHHLTSPTTTIMFGTTSKTSFQPKVPGSTFPILVHVTHSDASMPGTDGANPGDIHLGPSTISIFSSGSWEQWDCLFPFPLVLERERYVIAPCPSHGIQVIGTNDSYEKCVMDTRGTLGLGESAPLEVSHVQLLLRRHLWPAKVCEIHICYFYHLS